MLNENKGFTLAEVLITLLIIGVVASLTIPVLINNTNEAEYNVSVKKAYSEVSNAIKMIQTNNSGAVNVGTAETAVDATPLRNDFCNVMICNKIGTSVDIFGPTNYYAYKSSLSTWPMTYADDAPAAILNNGYLINFYSYTDCNKHNINACGAIYVDINGTKGPKMWGKDLYGFWIVKKQPNTDYLILPMGTQGDNLGDCAVDTWENCTALRLINPENLP